MAGGPREADSSDRAPLASVLADAFWDDPVPVWASPRDDLRPAMLRRFFGAMLDAKLPEGFVYADSEMRGGAIWAPPGGWKTSLMQDLRICGAFADPRLWRRGPLVGPGLLKLEKVHPQEPHFYLFALGVSPAAQGQGLGSQLMQPVLDLCDREGVPAHLESSKHSNIAYYERHGFRKTGEIRMPRGPALYPMWREPRS
jgi:ribosomal protein S18 acetylase RimI-like enzyme